MEGYSEMIEYKYDVLNITAIDLEPFFEGWSKKPTPEKRLGIIQNNNYVIFALDNKKVIGFITLMVEGISSPVIIEPKSLRAFRRVSSMPVV